MSIFSAILNNLKNRSLAALLLLFILMFSFFFTLAETGLQLYLEYQTDVDFIEEQFQQIEKSYLKSITVSTWNVEADEVALQLEGALHLRDIRYLEVRTEMGNILAKAGEIPDGKTVSHRFLLEYRNYGKVNPVGALDVIASMEGVYHRLYDRILVILSSRAIKTFLMSGFILIIFQYLVSRHLGTMAQYARHLDLNTLEDPLILKRSRSKNNVSDELEMVVSAVNEMRVRILDDITNRKRMENELRKLNSELEQRVTERTGELSKAMDALWGEMELAKKLQTVLLPKKPKIPGYDIAASLSPADEVGGDYYDVISVEGYDWLIIGDVSGHGVVAGLVMMMAQTAIHTVLLNNPEVPASHLLSVINRIIYNNIEKLGNSKHMTIVVLAGGKDGIFTFSGLHEDILVWRADTEKVDKIETEGTWIGLEPDISKMLSEEFLSLEPKDCLVLFTDGITEAEDENGELFGDERLVEIIERTANKSSASEIHKSIIDALKPYEKPDDVTLLVMKRN